MSKEPQREDFDSDEEFEEAESAYGDWADRQYDEGKDR